MARALVPLPFVQAQGYWISDEPGHEAWIASVRDALRTALDGDNLHTNWLVGDVAKWDGASSFVGYGFSIKHMSSSVPTGPEWCFFFPGSYSGGLVDMDDMFQVAQLSEYFRDTGNSTTFTTNGCFALHYSPIGGYDFGYDGDGALGGGDFSVPTTNPYTNANGFMPATGDIYGLCTAGGINLGSVEGKWAMLFDDQKPFATLYAASIGGHWPELVWLSGEIITPNVVADTDTSASCTYRITNSTTEAGAIDQWNYAYDSVGVRTNFTAPECPLLIGNFPDGTAMWTDAILHSTNYLKGAFDSDVVRVLGSYNRGDQGGLYDTGTVTFFKHTRSFGFPHVPNTPIFPHSEVP